MYDPGKYVFPALAVIAVTLPVFAQGTQTIQREIANYDVIIEDDAQAQQVCTALGAQHNAQWTGRWDVRYDQSGYWYSICDFAVTFTPNQQPQHNSDTSYERPPPPTVTRIQTEPLPDQSQAEPICMLVAMENEGRWTGRYAKTGMCEIETGAGVQVGVFPRGVVEMETVKKLQKQAHDMLMGLTPTQ